MRLGPKKRVRMHLIEPDSPHELPSIEGILISRRHREYLLALPVLLVAAGANPAELESRWVRIPRDRVAFYEVL